MTTDRVTVTTVVSTNPTDAFSTFTDEIDRWWRRSIRHRTDPGDSIVRFEDDHLVEVTGTGATSLARVVSWEPGRRLTLEWLDALWPEAGRTTIEITFEADGDGTRVTLTHSGWDGLVPGDARSSIIGLWWGDLLAGYTHPRQRTAA